MPTEPWEQLESEPALEAERYRVRRDTVRLPSGRIVNDYTVGELGDYSLVVASLPHDRWCSCASGNRVYAGSRSSYRAG